MKNRVEAIVEWSPGCGMSSLGEFDDAVEDALDPEK
jgi:hypothetical protein